MAKADMDKVVGIALVVIGALALLNFLSLGPIVTIGAILAVIMGIAILANFVTGDNKWGIAMLVIGLILLVPNWVGDVIGDVITTIAAVLILIIGILKLMGKW